MDNRMLFILNNQGEGGLKPFPKAFDLPPRVRVGEKWYTKTEYTRVVDFERLPIYVQEPCRISPANYATPEEEEQNED